VGPSDGGSMSATNRELVKGLPITVNGVHCAAYGSADLVSPTLSAYLVVDGSLPEFIVFGRAQCMYGELEEPVVYGLNEPGPQP
jgi:hypothetical protein